MSDLENEMMEEAEGTKHLMIRYRAFDNKHWEKKPEKRRIVMEATEEKAAGIIAALGQWKAAGGDWEAISRKSDRILMDLIHMLEGIENFKDRSVGGGLYITAEVLDEPKAMLLAEDVEELINVNRRDREQNTDDPDMPGYVKACEELICFLGDLPVWNNWEAGCDE